MLCDLTGEPGGWQCVNCGRQLRTSRRPLVFCRLSGPHVSAATPVREPVDILLLCDAAEAAGMDGHRIPAPPCHCESEIAATIRACRPRAVYLGGAIAHHLDALRGRDWGFPVAIEPVTG
jgi:hypothetical protein